LSYQQVQPRVCSLKALEVWPTISREQTAQVTSHQQTTTMNREDLYALVWQTPLSRLAKRFGLSDVGLQKICMKHDIPTPPLGYWTKRMHGKPVSQPPLSPSQTGANIVRLVERAGREAKAPWWEFFRLSDLTEEELFEEKTAVSGLRFEARTGGTKKCPVDRYIYESVASTLDEIMRGVFFKDTFAVEMTVQSRVCRAESALP
jgi:hypothetical protein